MSLRLLLTRAVADAARTRTRLEQRGHRVIVSPVIDIVATGAGWPHHAVDGVLATSRHAFALLSSEDWPPPETRRLVPLFLVGQRTEEAARAHGFAGAAQVAASARDLAGAMRHQPERRLLYLAGRDRKACLETALAETTSSCEVVEVYEARPRQALDVNAAEAMRTGAVDAVIHYSRRSAELFIALASAAGCSATPARQFCLSEDVAGPLRSAGYATVLVASAPTEAALLAMVDQA